MAEVLINGKFVTVEPGNDGYWYYRDSYNQNFGKKVKLSGDHLLVWNSARSIIEGEAVYGVHGDYLGPGGTPGPGGGDGSEYPPEFNPNFEIIVDTIWDGASLTLPLVSGYNYDFDIDWGDGSSDHITAWNDANITHTYALSADHSIVISGLMEAWAGDNDFAKRILKVENIGSTGLRTGFEMFSRCWNLTEVTGDADFSLCTSLSGMFDSSSVGILDIGGWDVSTIEDFSNMFWYAIDISSSSDLSKWDVSSAQNMYGMFTGIHINNNIMQPNVTDWDVSNVTNFGNMFQEAYEVVVDVSKWDTSSAQNMESMFEYTNVADPDVSNWDVSSVTSMEWMFSDSLTANPDMSGWTAPNLESTWGMFYDAIGITNEAPASLFWDNPSVVSYNNTFNNAINISNYASIPVAWK